MWNDSNDVTADIFTQILLRILAEWLTRFWCIDAVEPDADFRVVGCQNVDRIAIDNVETLPLNRESSGASVSLSGDVAGKKGSTGG